MAEQTLNMPQIIVFLIVTFLAARWWLRKPASVSPHPSQTRPVVRANPAQIDQVANMFPQLDRRSIAWDLQRNGGNVSATTEKVLSGRSLDTPPASFNPTLPRSNTPSRTATPPVGSSQPDLITRYNLASKVGKSPEPAPEEQPKPKAWSQDRNERQANLQRRREEMILAARRKLEELEKAKA